MESRTGVRTGIVCINAGTVCDRSGFDVLRFFPGFQMGYFCTNPSGRIRMTGTTGITAGGMNQMGALLWFLFVGAVMVVLERETFFS